VLPIQNGIQQFADFWTLTELIAHLDDPQGRTFRSSFKALRRCVNRALIPSTEQLRVTETSEVLVSRIVFGQPLPHLQEYFTALKNLARAIASYESVEEFLAELPIFSTNISIVAKHVQDKEEWFSEYFEDLRQRYFKIDESYTTENRKADVNSFIDSIERDSLDAKALINRAYKQSKQAPPNSLPADLVSSVSSIFRLSSLSVGLLVKKILCDNVNLQKSSIRNYLWDQEVAGNIGQIIEGLPVLLVTDDKFFREVAREVGYRHSVCTLKEYISLLGLKV